MRAGHSARRLVHGADGLNTGVWPVPMDHLITPAELFFTRSHAPAPALDAATWRLQVSGLVEQPTSLSLVELNRQFSRRDVTATLVCAGLRRNELLSMGPLPGELPWGPEPISTAHWSGVALADVLRSAGVSRRARHVEFIGLDQVERGEQRFGFGGSIEIDKALSPEVLLATDLNGAPIPKAHGHPLRVVVPGWIGARSVKWLGRINVLEQPSSNYFQSKAYRLQREVNHSDPRDVSAGTALTEVPINSVIVYPTADAVVPAGRLRLAGWAIGSGGRPVKTVELSKDAGKTWRPARIRLEGEGWSWSFWEGELSLSKGPHLLTVRATDSVGSAQPASLSDSWNVKGYNNNAWHRVPVEAE